MASRGELTDEELRELYKWVDAIPLSKVKKNISRDFSDGVMVGEIVYAYFPHIVPIHSFSYVNNTEAKKGNWNLLNRKVFKMLRFKLGDDVIEDLARSKPGVIEKVLHKLRNKIDQALFFLKQNHQEFEPLLGGKSTGRQDSQKTEVDQYYEFLQQNPDFILRRVPFDPYEYSPGRKGQGFRTKSLSPTRGGVMYSLYPPQRFEVLHSDNLIARGTAPVLYHDPPPDLGVAHTYNMQNLPVRPVEPFVPNAAFAHHHNQQQVRQQQPAFSGTVTGLPELDTVSTLMYEDKVQESMVKDETIQILQAKIMRLEHLVHLKNSKVDDLNRQLEQIELREQQKRPVVKQKRF